MAKIIIKKRIALDFLGDEYKDSYFVFKTIPLRDYESLMADLDNIQAEPKKAIPFMLKVLKDYFEEGKFQGEDVDKDNLDDIDQPTAIEIFQRLTGQSDPKSVGQSEPS